MNKDIFEVGLTLSFESYFRTHHTTTVLGWEKDVFLLTKVIYVDGKPAEIQSDDACKIRFLNEGVAYGFESTVAVVQFFPFPVMFVRYPHKIECVKIRTAQRYKVDVPARFSDAQGTLSLDAVITDISEGGCGLKVQVAQGEVLVPDVRYKISFQILDNEIEVECAVRKLNQTRQSCFVGTEFTELSASNKQLLNNFIGLFNNHVVV